LEDSTQSNHQEFMVRKISSCLLPMIDDLDEQTQAVLKKYLDDNMTQQMIAKEL
jgi:DNA-directed RNA polymerase specialized sigma subunit